MPKAYSYIRFSTPEQRLGHSEVRQLEAAEAWAKANGFTLDHSLRDLGKSAFRGKNATKGALGRFLDGVGDGTIPSGSVVIIEDLDRLSRQEPMNTVEIVKQIVSKGVSIVVLKDNLRITRENLSDLNVWLPFALKISLSHEESAKKSTRIKATYKARRDEAEKSGRPVMQRPPSWLKLSADGKSWELIPEKAATIRRIFKMKTKEGLGYVRIAGALNDEGVPVIAGAAFWRPSYIKRLVKNRALIGEVTLSEDTHVGGKIVKVPQKIISDYYPRVLSDAEFFQVNFTRAVLKTKARDGTKNLLSGLVFCGYCEAPMDVVGTSKKPDGSGYHTYLYCSKARVKAGCKISSSWNIETFHDALLIAFDEFITFGSQSEDKTKLVALKAQIDGMNSKLEKLQEFLAEAPSLSGAKTVAKMEAQRDALLTSLEDERAKTVTARGSGIESMKALQRAVKKHMVYEVNSFFRGYIERMLLWVIDPANPKEKQMKVYLKDGRVITIQEERLLGIKRTKQAKAGIVDMTIDEP